MRIASLVTGRSPALALTATLAVAAGLRLIEINGYQGLNGDEAFTVALAQRHFLHMLHLFRFEGNGVLYPIVMWPLIRIDDSTAMLRAPAAIAGVAAVAAVYWTGTRLVGRAAALIAALLLAVSPLAISYSQLARPYMFAILFGTLSFGVLDRALDDNSTHWWAGYTLVTAALAYSNALALTLLLPHALLAIGHPRSRRRWLAAMAALAILLAPLALLLALERGRRNPLYWLNPPGWPNLNNVAQLFLVNRYGLAVAAATLLLSLPRLLQTPRLTRRALVTVAAWAVIPILTLYIGSLVISPVFWVGYLLPALPGAILLVGTALTHTPRPIALVALAALAAISIRGNILHRDSYHPTGWQTAARELAVHRNPNDPVVFDIPDGLVAAGYYDAHFTSAQHHLIVNEWHDEHLPVSVVLLDDPGGYGDAPNGPPSTSLLARLAKPTGTVYVALYEINRQGNVDRSAGLTWARNHCRITTNTYGDDLTLISLRACAS